MWRDRRRCLFNRPLTHHHDGSSTRLFLTVFLDALAPRIRTTAEAYPLGSLERGASSYPRAGSSPEGRGAVQLKSTQEERMETNKREKQNELMSLSRSYSKCALENIRSGDRGGGERREGKAYGAIRAFLRMRRGSKHPHCPWFKSEVFRRAMCRERERARERRRRAGPKNSPSPAVEVGVRREGGGAAGGERVPYFGPRTQPTERSDPDERTKSRPRRKAGLF